MDEALTSAPRSKPGSASVAQAAVTTEERNELLSLRLRQAAMLMAVQLQRISEIAKLSVSQCHVLQHLCSGPAKVGEIGQLLEIGSGGATRLIDQLEDRGFVRRRRSTVDRRSVHIEITSEGAAALEGGRAMLQRAQSSALATFSVREQDDFAALLDRLIQSLRVHPRRIDTPGTTYRANEATEA